MGDCNSLVELPQAQLIGRSMAAARRGSRGDPFRSGSTGVICACRVAASHQLRLVRRQVAYYIACVIVPLLGVFVLGKAWFAVAIAMCLGIPIVNWLTRGSRGNPVGQVADFPRTLVEYRAHAVPALERASAKA